VAKIAVQVMEEVWINAKGISPFGDTPIHRLNTPGRMLVWSQRAMDFGIVYAQELKLFDDFYTFLQVFELSVQNKLRVFGINDSDIYVYNQLNDNTATKR
jgi:hypothetical protein